MYIKNMFPNVKGYRHWWNYRVSSKKGATQQWTALEIPRHMMLTWDNLMHEECTYLIWPLKTAASIGPSSGGPFDISRMWDPTDA